ncbi:MAG: response regulator, partial [Actinomycetes bacterium]
MSETSPGLFEVHPGVGASTATRVLLVEDDEGDAFLVRELLTDAAPDIAIERVRTLAEAGVLLPGRFDCVLLDLGLPDAAGLEALRMVLEAAPSLAVLVLTG